MSVVAKVNNVVDKLFGWLDGPEAKPVPVPVRTPRQAPVPSGATKDQKEVARLAAMSPKARASDIRRTNRAYALAAKPGAIQPIGERPGWFHVLSGDGTHWYVVTAHGKGFCDCADQEGYARYHGGCYHLRAVRMYISGTKQVAAEIIKEKRTPMPNGTSTNAAIARFLKSCCDVHFYASGGLWRGTWLDGYELSQGGGTFEKQGFTQRQLMDYAADHEEIMLAMPRKTRGQIRISVHANKQEHRDRKTLRAAQVLEAKGKPKLGELITEQNREMAIEDSLREDFENVGQQVAAAVRAVDDAPKGNGHKEQAEPVVDPEDDPGPLAEPTIIGAIVTAHGVFLTMSNGEQVYKVIKPNKTPEDAYVHLRKMGLAETAKSNGGTADATVTLAVTA